MNSKKLRLGIVLTIIGIIGIASMLTMEITLPPEAEAILRDKFSPGQIKLLLLINPTMLLIVAVAVGTALYDKVNLRLPLLERLTGISGESINPFEIIKYGVLAGLLSGVLLSLIGGVFTSILPSEFQELGDNLQPTLAVRFLYGGFTEEILMRFGLMTFIVWVASKIAGRTKPIVYWSGILLAAVIFAFGHFPVVFQSVESPSSMLLSYILLGNSVGGIIFGWVYWKKGLESAFVAHIFAHVVMVSAGAMLS
ncbi:CPBP family intramembrane glutamic endopeptidase [Catalinimonas sp. 4WD22]|uniref:CPBP family intramembrane glutamic endopeptidase n=1 Tax=Catalinimonas locisalis TaxID=3133978 RepID=UPI0031013AC8